nr:hypothetical protein [Tanacetum cinerariifolium]
SRDEPRTAPMMTIMIVVLTEWFKKEVCLRFIVVRRKTRWVEYRSKKVVYGMHLSGCRTILRALNFKCRR